jgi:hypothetical protein
MQDYIQDFVGVGEGLLHKKNASSICCIHLCYVFTSGAKLFGWGVQTTTLDMALSKFDKFSRPIKTNDDNFLSLAKMTDSNKFSP